MQKKILLHGSILFCKEDISHEPVLRIFASPKV